MAGDTKNGTAEDRKPTERVVLELANVLVIPPDASAEQIDAAREALKAKRGGKATARPAWLEVRRVEGASKTAAIESYAGKAGTSTAKVGTFRAPTVTAWKGAVVHDQPPEPLITRSMID